MSGGRNIRSFLHKCPDREFPEIEGALSRLDLSHLFITEQIESYPVSFIFHKNDGDTPCPIYFPPKKMRQVALDKCLLIEYELVTKKSLEEKIRESNASVC
jgi:hypothetical protein